MALVGLLLLKFTLLASLTSHQISILLVMPMLSRWVFQIGVIGFPYARPQGLGKGIHETTQLDSVSFHWMLSFRSFLLSFGICWAYRFWSMRNHCNPLGFQDFLPAWWINRRPIRGDDRAFRSRLFTSCFSFSTVGTVDNPAKTQSSSQWPDRPNQDQRRQGDGSSIRTVPLSVVWSRTVSLTPVHVSCPCLPVSFRPRG